MLSWVRKYRHRRYHRLLSEYTDDRLKDAVRARLEAHLEVCAVCWEALEALQATVKALRNLPQAPLPRSFILTETPATEHAARPRPVLLRSMQLSSAVTAVLLAALVVGDAAGLFPTQAQAPVPTATTPLRTATEAEGEQGPAGPAVPAATPTPAPRPATIDRQQAGVKLTPEVLEPPRSALATALLALKVALAVAVAILAGATGYLVWRQRRRRAM